MTNEPINMNPTIERRLAQIARDRELFANPILPAKVNRPAPRSRTRTRRRRAIR